MITSINLKQYLDDFDNSESTEIITIQQQQILNNLRFLTNVPIERDLSLPITNLLKGITINHANPLSSLDSLLLKLQTAINHPVLPPSNTLNTTNAEQWLFGLIQQVQSMLGGDFLLYRDSFLKLKLNGPLTMKYSVFMALISARVIDRSVYLDNQHINGELLVNLNEGNLDKLYQSSKALGVVKHFLQHLGFTVEIGSKTCEQSLSQNSAFLAKNNMSLITDYNMSLDVANALYGLSASQILLPLTLKITTYDDSLMNQLESYYSHPLVNLRSRDGTKKTFILETRGPGCLHESVLNIDQLAILRDFFDRLSYFSQYYKKAAVNLTEKEINSATLDIYSEIEKNKKALLSTSTGFEVRNDYKPLGKWYLFSQPDSLHFFEKSIESLCKENLIPGPNIFMNDTDFIYRFNKIQSDIFNEESFQKWPNFKESYHYTDNSTLPRSPVPLYYYAQAIAKATLGQEATIGSLYDEHQQGMTWLNKTVNRELYGSSANQHYYDFYTENNAYYLLDSLVSCIKMCLDNPRCTEYHVAELLSLIHVSAESTEVLSRTIEGDKSFNRFQIKLFLLPLVLNGLCKIRLLENIIDLAANRSSWVRVSMPNGNTSYVGTPNQWYVSMRDWKNNEIKGINWGIGGPSSTSQQRYYQDTTQRNTLFAGGAQADNHRQQQTERSSVVSKGSYS